MGSYFYFSRQYRLYVYIVGFVGADLCVCPDAEYIGNGASLATSLVVVHLPSESQLPTTQLLLANGWQLQFPKTGLHRQVIRPSLGTTKSRSRG